MYALLCNKTLYIYIYINKSNAPQVLFACLGLVGTVRKLDTFICLINCCRKLRAFLEN